MNFYRRFDYINFKKFKIGRVYCNGRIVYSDSTFFDIQEAVKTAKRTLDFSWNKNVVGFHILDMETGYKFYHYDRYEEKEFFNIGEHLDI